MIGYRIATLAYHLFLRLFAFFGHSKAKAWWLGRQHIAPAAVQKIKTERQAKQGLIWLHAASLGEFEQGRPVLEKLRAHFPAHYIVVTFFSPSGYERCKTYAGADAISYLPLDTPQSAEKWVEDVRPNLVIFVKYEFWLYHLRALRQQQIRTILIAGAFRPSQPFFKWYGGAWRTALRGYDQVLVQTTADRDQLLTLSPPLPPVTVTGDPRADRVLELAKADFIDAKLQVFSQDYHCLLAGSVWPKDISLLLQLQPLLPSDWRLIIAPHQLKENEIGQWAKAFNAVRYTQTTTDKPISRQVMILDTIGILSRSYRYARLAYIGGGFGAGIHNTLEPMAYDLPVIFGPRYYKFPEAVKTVASGGSFTIASAATLISVFEKLQKEQAYQAAQKAVQQYTQSVKGAVDRTTVAITTAGK